MPTGPENIDKFRVQIENSLNARIEQLREKDAGQVQVLSKMQRRIMMLIDEGKHLEDLQLKDGEMQKVYEGLTTTERDVLESNGVKSYADFLMFLGITDTADTDFVEGGGAVEIFGKQIEIKLPIGITSRQMNYYHAAAALINRTPRMKPLFEGRVFLEPFDLTQLLLVTEKEGKRVTYLVSDSSILRLDSELPKENKQKLLAIRLECEQFYRQVEKEINADATLTIVERSLTVFMFSNARLRDSSSFTFANFEMAKKYSDKLEQFKKMVDRRKILTDICGTFDLLNEETGERIRDTNNYISYTRQYLDKEGRVRKAMRYDYGMLKVDTDYDPSNGEVQVESKYNNNGLLTSKREGKFIYTYDHFGNRMTVVALKPNEDTQDILISSADGKEMIGEFAYEKEVDPEMTEDVYFEKFKKIINNEELYYRFEENFLSTLGDDLGDRIRKYGMEITGVGEKLEAFSRKYHISIVVDGRGGLGEDSAAYMPLLKAVNDSLYELESLISIYPPLMFQRFAEQISLKTKVVVSGKKVGGVASFYWMTLKMPLTKEAFHHEFLHSLDYSEYFGSDRYFWAKSVHGDDYGEFLDKTGIGAEYKEGSEVEEGYASVYGKEGGVLEDRAEIGAFLISDYKAQMAKARKDPMLLKKIAMIKEFYYRKSEGAMDKRFWQDLGNGVKIDQNYWRKRDRSKRSGRSGSEGMRYLGV